MVATDIEARYAQLSIDDVRQFVADGQEENLHLEFKIVVGSDLSADDRRNLAKALSGFANSEGGLVVWGVDARKNSHSVDCACALTPVAGVAALCSRLNQLTSDLVSPIVDGVQHRAVHKESDGTGYAVTLVPPSDSGPHMAKGREDRYYKRSGDSFVRLEHFDVADMFGRRPHPKLDISVDVRRAGRVGRDEMFRLVLGIKNSGKGIARAPHLGVRVVPPYSISQFGIDGNGSEGLPRFPSAEPEWVSFGGMADIVIHPGTSRPVFGIKDKWSPEAPADLEIEFELAAVGVPLQIGTYTFRSCEIVERLLR